MMMNADDVITLAVPPARARLFLMQVYGRSRYSAAFEYRRLVFPAERPTFRTSDAALTTHLALCPLAVTQ